MKTRKKLKYAPWTWFFCHQEGYFFTVVLSRWILRMGGGEFGIQLSFNRPTEASINTDIAYIQNVLKNVCQTEGPTDKQTDRLTDRQMDKQVCQTEGPMTN